MQKRIRCACEVADNIRHVGYSREELIEILTRYGFGRSAGVPTDWTTYYETHELLDFYIEYEIEDCE